MNEYIDGCKKVQGKGVLQFTNGNGIWIDAITSAQPNYADGQNAVEIISIEIDPAGEPPDYSNEWGQACTFRTLGDISSTIFFYTTFKDQFDKWRWRINPDVASDSTCIEDTSDPDPDPSPSPSCTPFDPSQYKYVKYIGKASQSGGLSEYNIPNTNIPGGAFLGYSIDADGNIETPWTELMPGGYRYLGGLWCSVSGLGFRLYDAITNTTNGYHEQEFSGTRYTRWTPHVNFFDNVDGDIPGGPQIGTGDGVPWRANTTATSNGMMHGFGDTAGYLGGLGDESKNASPVPGVGLPDFAVRGNLCLHNGGPEPDGLYPPLNNPVTISINGYWAFSNDQVTVEATWLGTNDAGEDLECLPEPPLSSCTLFDPTVYTHVRFKGTATVTDYVDWSGYPDQEPGTYPVQSNWKYIGRTDDYRFDALFVGSAQGANPLRDGYSSELTSFLCNSPYTDSEGTTTWNSSYTNDNNSITPCGTGEAKPWVANVSVSTSGYESTGSNAIPRLHIGDVGKIRYINGLNTVFDSPFPYPANGAFPEFFAVVWTNRTNRDEVGSASIDGVWEFSNDGGTTIAATWKGLDDKGQDIEYLECIGYDPTVCPDLPYNPTWLSNPCPRLPVPIGPELTCPELPGPPEDLDPPIDIPEPDPEPDPEPISCCIQVKDGQGKLYSTITGSGWYLDPNWSDQLVGKFNGIVSGPRDMGNGTYAYTLTFKVSSGDVYSQNKNYVTPNPNATFCIRDYGDSECVGSS